jgi:hypothetical protein
MVFAQERKGSTTVSPFMVALGNVERSTSCYVWITDASDAIADCEGSPNSVSDGRNLDSFAS